MVPLAQIAVSAVAYWNVSVEMEEGILLVLQPILVSQNLKVW